MTYLFLLLQYALIGISTIIASSSSLFAITLTIPPSDGFQDIAVIGPQQVEGKTDLIYNYIQLANQYLWFAMIVICFVVVVRLWYKLMTNPAGSDEAKTALKKSIIAGGVGLAIIMISYTIVRLVINIL